MTDTPEDVAFQRQYQGRFVQHKFVVEYQVGAVSKGRCPCGWPGGGTGTDREFYELHWPLHRDVREER